MRCAKYFAVRGAVRTGPARFTEVATLTHDAGRSFPDRGTLSRADEIVVRAIAEAMFSQDGEVDAERLDALVPELDAYISAASMPIRIGLRIALFVVRIAPILMFFRLRTIERLAVDDRVAFLARLERSNLTPLSLAFIGWRTVMTFIFYEDPIELRNLGYTSDERLRYKRRLPALVAPAAVVHAPALVAAAALVRAPRVAETPLPFVALVAQAPPAAESGVRLRDVDTDDAHAHPHAAHAHDAHEHAHDQDAADAHAADESRTGSREVA